MREMREMRICSDGLFVVGAVSQMDGSVARGREVEGAEGGDTDFVFNSIYLRSFTNNSPTFG
jgi:hypothetical protein